MRNFIREEDDYWLRLKGTHQAECAAGTITVLDFICDKAYSINGCQYEVASANFGDKIRFQVVMGDQVLNEYAHIYAINGVHTMETYKADLAGGLKLRVIYENVGASSALISVNSFLHEVRS